MKDLKKKNLGPWAFYDNIWDTFDSLLLGSEALENKQ
jgi:hypothetical protein